MASVCQQAVPAPSEAEYQAAQRVLAERHLHHYARQAWRFVESQPFVETRSFRAVCEHLEAVTRGEIRKLLINIPPRLSKSLTTCVFWPSWEWGPANLPQYRWIFGSYAHKLAIRDNVRARNIIQSQWYQQRWGSRVQLVEDQNEKGLYKNTANGFRLATCPEGMATGEGGDRVIVDDPHNVKKAESAVEREGVIDWYSGTMWTRVNNPDVIARVIIMQRLNEADLSGWAIEQGDWEHLCLPMRYDEQRPCTTIIGFKDWRSTEGELLCPERFTDMTVKEWEKTLGAYGTAGQLQQQPAPKGGAMFSRSNIRYFTTKPVDENACPRYVEKALRFQFELMIPGMSGKTRRFNAWDCYWFQACDTATSEKEEAAYTVVTTCAVTPEHDLLVWEVVRERLEVPKQYGHLLSQRARYQFLDFQAVEEASSGIGIIQLARSEGHPFKVLKTGMRSKDTRAACVATMYENGKVYHRLPNAQQGEWLPAFENELVKFPRGEFADQVDTMAYAGLIVTQRAAGAGNIRSAGDEEMKDEDGEGFDLKELDDMDLGLDEILGE